MANGFQLAYRISEIRKMLDERIQDSDYVIGAFIMTIFLDIEFGKTNEMIVDTLVSYGKTKEG